MRKYLLLSFIMVFALLVNSASIVSASVSVDIKVNDFVIGEKVKFDYSFLSDRDEEIIYTPQIKCIRGYESLLADMKASLTKGSSVTRTYEGFEVTKELESQQCLAIVKIKKPFTKIKEEIFEIVTEPSFSFYIKICKDSSCTEESRVFFINNKIYLDYNTDIENPEIKAILTYPDKTTKQITLPTSIKASKIGTYILEVEASKEGYKTITKKEQFGVIKKEADIKYAAELMPEKRISEFIYENKFEILISLISVVIAVLIILYFIKRMRKKEHRPSAQINL